MLLQLLFFFLRQRAIFCVVPTYAFHLSLCLTYLCINQSLSPLRPLGDSNDTAHPSGGWGWDEVQSLFTQGELAED